MIVTNKDQRIDLTRVSFFCVIDHIITFHYKKGTKDVWTFGSNYESLTVFNRIEKIYVEKVLTTRK